jgi:hypothetical protein
MQNFARKGVISIDTISWGFEVIDRQPGAIVEKPADGCYIYGLFLEGARWDNETRALAEARPKTLFESFPVMWLKPEADRPRPDKGARTRAPAAPSLGSILPFCTSERASASLTRVALLPRCRFRAIIPSSLPVPARRHLHLPCVQNAHPRGRAVHDGPLDQLCALR